MTVAEKTEKAAFHKAASMAAQWRLTAEAAPRIALHGGAVFATESIFKK